MASGRAILLLVVAILGAGLVFWLFPGIDLAVSRYFFDGIGFPVASNRGVEALRVTLYTAEDITFVLTLALLIVTLWRRAPIMGLVSRDWGFQLTVFVLGPGVLANLILKRLWGRARPWRVTEFGGTAQFTPPWQITDQCQANCSFISGEMSGATALMIALLMILAANRIWMGESIYRLGQTVALALPLVTAWQRVAVGRHFLSDVVFAGLFVTLIAAVLARLFYGPMRR